jgi:predicted Zn finger-like uncharacterized protein
MIVTCEGCETTFHVGDGLIKPSGSKVRCSKCRHVFTAYASAQETDAIEPLTLTDELPAVPAPSEGPEADGIEPRWDALFASIDAAETGRPGADAVPGLLNVDDLLDSAEGGGEGARRAGFEDDAQFGLDMDLDLDVIDEAAEDDETAADGRAPATGDTRAEAAVLGDARDLDIHDIHADLEPADWQEDGEILPPALDELEIDMDELAGLEEAAGFGPETALPGTESGDAESELDLDLDALSLEASERDGEELADIPAGGQGETDGAGWKDPVAPAATAMDDLDLGLEMEAGAGILEPVDSPGPPADGATGGVDELDLSDLEAMLEEAEATATDDSKSGGAPGDQDLDLLSEILPQDQTPGEAEELGLASLATVLENGGAAAPEPEEDDLDLGFLDEMEHAEHETASVSKEVADELDFSDMDHAFDSADDPGSDKSLEEQELELLFDDELSGAAAAREPEAARDEDAPLLDIETLLGDDGVTQDERVSVEAGDMEIEIEPLRRGLEDRLLGDPNGVAGAQPPAATSQAATDEFSTDEFTNTGLTGATGILETERVAATPLDTESPARTGSRKTVWAVLAVLLLAVAALVVPRGLGIHIPYLSDIQIPLIDDLLKSEPEDPRGNLKLTPVEATISADFIDNPTAGRLCVISGQVRNDYGHPRSHLQVTVRLYTKDKAVAKSATVFAGNLLSKDDLARLDLAAINARPNLKAGANDVNLAVPPGKTVPFMVVLGKLPADADEYSVEVGGSTK